MSVANGTFTRTQSFGPESRNPRLSGLYPRFYLLTEDDPIASEREGRKCSIIKEMVDLIVPGNALSIVPERVTDEHRQHWEQEYKAFKAGNEISPDGYPLELWPVLNKAQVADFKAIHLLTVEHVANMSDHACQRLMGGMRWRALAKAYLDEAEEGALLAKITAENDRKDVQIAELNHKVEELSALLNRMHSDMQALKDTPSPLATVIPGMGDPYRPQVQAPQPQPQAGPSSLDMVPEVRRRGRPPLPRDADGNPVRESV